MALEYIYLFVSPLKPDPERAGSTSSIPLSSLEHMGGCIPQMELAMSSLGSEIIPLSFSICLCLSLARLNRSKSSGASVPFPGSLVGAGTCCPHNLLAALVPEVPPAAPPGLGQCDRSILCNHPLPAWPALLPIGTLGHLQGWRAHVHMQGPSTHSP